MAESRPELTLHLSTQNRRLTVMIANSSRQQLRLWEWTNSWGWRSLAVQVLLGVEEQIEVRHKPREWTKNGPDYLTLEPQERHEVVIDPQDGWWEIAAADSASVTQGGWRNRPVQLRARLQIPRTPESDRLGVFVGIVFSEWITSDPPHNWLIIDSPGAQDR